MSIQSTNLTQEQEAFVQSSTQVLIQTPLEIRNYLCSDPKDEKDFLLNLAAERARDFQNARFSDPAFIAAARQIIAEEEADTSGALADMQEPAGPVDITMRLYLSIPESIRLSRTGPTPTPFDALINPEIMDRVERLASAKAVVALDAAMKRIMDGRGLHDYEPSLSGLVSCTRCGDTTDYQTRRKRLMEGELCSG